MKNLAIFTGVYGTTLYWVTTHIYIYQATGQSFGRVAVGGNGTGCTFPTVRPNPTGKGRTQCITCLPLPKVSLSILHLTEFTELRQGHTRSNKAPNTGLQKSFLSLTQNTLLASTVQMDFFLKGIPGNCRQESSRSGPAGHQHWHGTPSPYTRPMEAHPAILNFLKCKVLPISPTQTRVESTVLGPNIKLLESLS